MNTHESWDELYRLAIYESDVKRLPDRITNARHAILARIEELHESGEGGGEERLKVALEILEDLSDAALRTRVLTKHRMDSDWPLLLLLGLLSVPLIALVWYISQAA